ncbi:unnamed protein product [Paramecium octaurelia]|uniref:Uncharacterized protein n=1 Tax=Paramecium octaurelia TaxID=43137 RepID=A0A8S1XFP1_PAROT|nr:unnamed protein product [Paramecium octaurelia]
MKRQSESSFIKEKYYFNDRDAIEDPLANSIDEYLKRSKKRIYGFALVSFAFLLLLIPPIILEPNLLELIVLPQKGVTFVVTKNIYAPITFEIISAQSYSIQDIQLYLDGNAIEHFTIYQELISNSTHTITSNKSFQFSINLMIVAVRLISQFTYIPDSYLIIQIVMFVLSFLFLIQELLRKQKF